MGIFKDATAGGSVVETGKYFPDGKHVVIIDAVKMVKGRKGDNFIVESVVLESTNSECSPGEKYGWVLAVTYNEAAKNNAKTFVARMYGLKSLDDIDKAGDLVVSEDNPMHGTIAKVWVDTRPQKRNPQKDFSYHTWDPVTSDRELAEKLCRDAGVTFHF